MRRVAKRQFSTGESLMKTALYDLHIQYGGRMVPFAGWSMPIWYDKFGTIAAHNQTRTSCALFDVSHMQQIEIEGSDRELFMESLTVVDMQRLKLGKSCLSAFTNYAGGIIDDTMITKFDKHLYVVSNAGRAQVVWNHLISEKQRLRMNVQLKRLEEHSLLALQGPNSSQVISEHLDLGDLKFLDSAVYNLGNTELQISRSGYTGEDGFEIRVPSAKAMEIARLLLKNENVKLAGLGARGNNMASKLDSDTLRLEAGLCLYGQDIDETTSPVEAGLSWIISKNLNTGKLIKGKRRRLEGGFPGYTTIKSHLKEGTSRKRVGLIGSSGMPPRSHLEVFDMHQKKVGEVTSGGPSPTLGKNIAMAYISDVLDEKSFLIKIREKFFDYQSTKLPFVPSNYHK